MGSSEERDSIDFLAKYKEWIAIKKMSISDDTKPEEIAFHLASIRQTIDKKAFEILSIDTKQLDELANKITGGARKSYKALAEAIASLGSQEARDIVAKACNGKEELQEVANAYLLRKVVQNLGFDFDVNQEMLAKVYPQLKIPKPLGRKPKA
jgi:vacuolar-type H+-ATPase subunit H